MILAVTELSQFSHHQLNELIRQVKKFTDAELKLQAIRVEEGTLRVFFLAYSVLSSYQPVKYGRLRTALNNQ